MKIHSLLRILAIVLTLSVLGGLSLYLFQKNLSRSQEEHGFEPIPEPDTEEDLHPRLRGLTEWKRPEGPVRVGIQVGHWKAAEAPDEQENLRRTTGTSYGRITEWETSLRIAEEAKTMLEAKGVVVDILPTTIPHNYSADAFISIHADGNENASVSGFKVAAPRTDYSKKGALLAQSVNDLYGKATGLYQDPDITRTMRGYYAFNWRRYEHSIHPMTPAAIIETGFLTNASDRRIIVSNPELSAKGITEGILAFLIQEKLLEGAL